MMAGLLSTDSGGGLLGRVGDWWQSSDQRAMDWMNLQRENLGRIRRYGEQHQMIWPGVAADAGTGLLDLVQGPRTGVMTPEAVMGLMDLGTIGVKPPGSFGAMALRRGAPSRGKLIRLRGRTSR